MSMTTLKPGRYVMTITGPTGDPIYAQTVVMEARERLSASLDDRYLQELQQVTSIAQGLVESELYQKEGTASHG